MEKIKFDNYEFNPSDFSICLNETVVWKLGEDKVIPLFHITVIPATQVKEINQFLIKNEIAYVIHILKEDGKDYIEFAFNNHDEAFNLLKLFVSIQKNQVELDLKEIFEVNNESI